MHNSKTPVCRSQRLWSPVACHRRGGGGESRWLGGGRAFGLLALLATCATAPAADPDFVIEKIIAAQASWLISSKEVELAITKVGAQMAPVTFFRDTDKPV